MCNQELKNIYFKESTKYKGFLILYLEMKNCFLILNNGILTKKKEIFIDETKITHYKKFNEKLNGEGIIKGIKIDNEMDVFIKINDDLYITLFRHSNSCNSYQVLDIFSDQEVDDDFKEIYDNESTEIQLTNLD